MGFEDQKNQLRRPGYLQLIWKRPRNFRYSDVMGAHQVATAGQDKESQGPTSSFFSC